MISLGHETWLLPACWTLREQGAGAAPRRSSVLGSVLTFRLWDYSLVRSDSRGAQKTRLGYPVTALRAAEVTRAALEQHHRRALSAGRTLGSAASPRASSA